MDSEQYFSNGPCRFYMKMSGSVDYISYGKKSELENSVTGQCLRSISCNFSTYLICCSRKEISKQAIEPSALEAMFAVGSKKIELDDGIRLEQFF